MNADIFWRHNYTIHNAVRCFLFKQQHILTLKELLILTTHVYSPWWTSLLFVRCIWAAVALCRGEWATPRCISYRLPTWCGSLPWLEWLLPDERERQMMKHIDYLGIQRLQTPAKKTVTVTLWHDDVPVHKNTVLFQSFWGPCRSCHRSSSNIKSALRRRLRSPYRCPSCRAPRRAGRAWNTLLTSTAVEENGRGGGG